MKKILLVLLLAITSIGVSGCVERKQQQTVPTTEEKPTTEEPKEEQPVESSLGLPTTDTLVHDESEYVVYVHQTGCPHCANVTPEVKEFSEKNPDIKVYDMNISDFDFFSKPYANSTNKNPKLPTAVTDDIKISSVPVVFYVKDGQIMKMGVGDQGDNNAIDVLKSIR